MKKLQNVIYIMSKGRKLSVSNRNICISEDGEKIAAIPVHNIESIVCFGEMSVTTPVMAFCSENDVSLSFLKENGTYYGSFYGAQKGNVFLRKNQYRMFDDEKLCLETARAIIDTKLKNQLRVLEKSSASGDRISNAASAIAGIRNYIENVENKEELRGYEGMAANFYFSVFDDLILTDDPEMKFEVRSRRPPKNNVNALLSFVYTLLENDVRAAVECTGLDSQVGVIHEMNYGKHALVYDMMEEFRAPLCDRFVLKLINKRQIVSSDFQTDEEGIFLIPEARKKVIEEWQERKKPDIYHKFFDEKISTGLLPFAQARIMSSYLRGNIPQYVPFTWR